MFRAILYTQWKWSRLFLLPAVIAAFALPLLSVRPAGGLASSWTPWHVHELLDYVESWSIWYAVLAGGIGLLLGTSAWSADHRGRHVYALSLPIPRWHYSLLRFAAGLLLLAAPAVALWISALLGTGTATIPPGLRAYPHAMALRFGLAALVAYALFFAIASGTARTAGWVLGGIGGIFALATLLSAAGQDVGIIEFVFRRLLVPGPLEVFTGRWMIIDV